MLAQQLLPILRVGLRFSLGFTLPNRLPDRLEAIADLPGLCEAALKGQLSVGIHALIHGGLQ
jgi:hypothetical protein